VSSQEIVNHFYREAVIPCKVVYFIVFSFLSLSMHYWMEDRYFVLMLQYESLVKYRSTLEGLRCIQNSKVLSLFGTSTSKNGSFPSFSSYIVNFIVGRWLLIKFKILGAFSWVVIVMQKISSTYLIQILGWSNINATMKLVSEWLVGELKSSSWYCSGH
jgi:hypothetical protein